MYIYYPFRILILIFIWTYFLGCQVCIAYVYYVHRGEKRCHCKIVVAIFNGNYEVDLFYFIEEKKIRRKVTSSRRGDEVLYGQEFHQFYFL